MAIVRSIPRRKRLASLRNVMMVDTVRGVLRVRKWPKKRGKPKSELQRWWNDWFKQANLLAKYADPMSQRRAIEMTKGSGLYPRDVLLSAMRGRLYVWADSNGWKWYPVPAIQDISDSLDVLAQTVGSVLVRATDRWRAPPAGASGQVLTHQGAAASPVWLSPAAAGVVEQELAESPVVPDNTVGQYDFNVASYASVELTIDGLGIAASDSIHFRFSTDGGSTFKGGASDYRAFRFTPTTQYNADRSTLLEYLANAASGFNGSSRFSNLRAGRAVQHGFVGEGATAGMVSGFANFDGPITDIRIVSGTGANFNAGTIRAVGVVAA